MKAVDELSSLKRIFESYSKKGLKLFPISRQTKRPAIENNLELATSDVAQLMEWAAKFPGCNWGLACAKSKYVVVDVDKKGLARWEELTKEHGEPQTLKQMSGSGVGFHLIFECEEGVRYRGKIEEGIDVKFNGYIAVEPSVHPSGGLYKWVKGSPKPAPLPEWLKALVIKPKEAKTDRKEINAGSRFYAKIMHELKDKPFGHEEWVKIGMALHDAFDGSQEGLDLYLELSQGVNYQEGDIEKAKLKWESFQKDAGGVTAGTLVYIARDLGCEIPNSHFDEDLAAFDVIETPPQSLQASTGVNTKEESEWVRTDSMLYTESTKLLVESLNKKGIAMLSGAQAGQLIQTYYDTDGLQSLKILNPDRFKNVTGHIFLKTKDAAGKTKYKPAASTWVSSPLRKTYGDVVFRQNPDKKDLNLWSPIPCKRVSGNIDLFLWLVHEVISAGNHDKAQYLIQWAAHIMQKPHEKTAVSPVLIGEQGTGKGLFVSGIMAGILKGYYLGLNSVDQYLARFNANQARRLLISLDEISMSSNDKTANRIKSRTGNVNLLIEEKFGGTLVIEDYSRLIMMTNNHNAVKIEPGNRRFLVYDVNKDLLGHPNYDKLWNTLRDDDYTSVIYDYLMGVDLTKFNAYRFPKDIDTGGTQTKIDSMGPVGQFWVEVIWTQAKTVFFSAMNCQSYIFYMDKNYIYEMFLKWLKDVNHWQRGITQTSFWLETQNLAPVIAENQTRRRFQNHRKRIILCKPDEFAKSFNARNKLNLPPVDDLDLVECLSEKIKEHEIDAFPPEIPHFDPVLNN